jgi:hypothetical protein
MVAASYEASGSEFLWIKGVTGGSLYRGRSSTCHARSPKPIWFQFWPILQGFLVGFKKGINSSFVTIQTKSHGVQACHGSSTRRSMRHGTADSASGAVACLGRGLGRGRWVMTGPRGEGGAGKREAG